eukprot:Nk52_evm37s255 gene=Nk52_evmTU37s255
MSAGPCRVLVSGDVDGNLTLLYKRVNTITKKTGTRFDVLLCVGNFFPRGISRREDTVGKESKEGVVGGEEGEDKEQEQGDVKQQQPRDEKISAEFEKYMNGEEKAPIETYVLGPVDGYGWTYVPRDQQRSGCQLCENIVYLGKRGIFTMSSGMTIGYLTGARDGYIGDDDVGFMLGKAADIQSSAERDPNVRGGIDILMTSEWPMGIRNEGGTGNPGSRKIGVVVRGLKPRYHFAGGRYNQYFEAVPYRNHCVLKDKAMHVTRFIALAHVGNGAKEKYISGFNIEPLMHSEISSLLAQPNTAIDCPYNYEVSVHKQVFEGGDSYFFQDRRNKRRIEGDRDVNKRPREVPPDNYKCKICNVPGHWIQNCPEKTNPRTAKQNQQPQQPCWFCLSSPEVEKHLVVSIGDSVYMALAKGALVEDHLLLLPISHVKSVASLSGTSDEVYEELDKFKAAVRQYYKEKLDSDAVFFERNVLSKHLQLQAVPVPKKGPSSAHLLSVFKDYAFKKYGLNFEEMNIYDVFGCGLEDKDYFLIELPTGEILLHKVTARFPLQLGRELLAHPQVLNMEDRVDWKKCAIEKDQEIEITKRVRKDFSAYDFTI